MKQWTPILLFVAACSGTSSPSDDAGADAGTTDSGAPDAGAVSRTLHKPVALAPNHDSTGARWFNLNEVGSKVLLQLRPRTRGFFDPGNLYLTDGSTLGPSVLDNFDGNADETNRSSTHVVGGTALGGFTYFAGTGEGSYHFYKTDGVTVTRAFDDTFRVFGPLVRCGDRICFSASKLENGNAVESGLYATDGTTSTRISESGWGSGRSLEIRLPNGSIVFVRTDELWVSGGTAESTKLLLGRDAATAQGDDYALVGGLLYTLGRSPGGKTVLIETDGTPGGSRIIKEVPSIADVRILGAAGGHVMLLFDKDFTVGTELYRLNDAKTDFELVKDMVQSGNGSSIVSNVTAHGGRLYFTNVDFADNAFSDSTVWRTDGTEAGTVRLYKPKAEDMVGTVTALGVQNGHVLLGALQLFALDEDSGQFEKFFTFPETGRGVEVIYEMPNGGLLLKVDRFDGGQTTSDGAVYFMAP